MARLRFNINLKTEKIEVEKPTRRLDGRNFASTIARDIGLQYAESRYNDLKSRLEGDIGQSIEREINNIAVKYGQVIPGTLGKSSTSFTLATKEAPGQLGAAAPDYIKRPKWDPLSPKYLRWKKRNGMSPGFFKTGEDGVGLQFHMSKGRTWTQLFGPVEVKLTRIATSEDRSLITFTSKFGSVNANFRQGNEIRYSIAKIEVRPFGDVTARMAEALKGGETAFQTTRNVDLIGLVYSKDEDLGHRLFGNSDTVPWKKPGGYRSTLEPFLGYVITRATPQIVRYRLQKELKQIG